MGIDVGIEEGILVGCDVGIEEGILVGCDVGIRQSTVKHNLSPNT